MISLYYVQCWFIFLYLVALKLKVIEDPDLRERHLGDLQGAVYREAAKLNPAAYKALYSQKTDQVIPVS